MRIMKHRTATLMMCILAAGTLAASEPAHTEDIIDGKRYEVGGFCYCIDKLSIDGVSYSGAFVMPSDNPALTFTGIVSVPSDVTIEDISYPVIGFTSLTTIPECIEGLEQLILPEGIRMVAEIGGARANIKNIFLPSTLQGLGHIAYQTDTLRVPGSVKEVYYDAQVGAKRLYLEDGVQNCSRNSLWCGNDTLVLPGSATFQSYSMTATELICLNIKRLTGDTEREILGESFCPYSYKIRSIVNDNIIPPRVAVNAFRLASYDGVDSPGMYDRATLFVPKASIGAYKSDPEWGRFEKIMAIEDGVNDVAADDAQVVATEYHDLYGRRLEAPAERGITIRTDVYSDGTRRCTKVLH